MHYTPLKKRKVHIQSLFKELSLYPEFVTKYDRDNLQEFSYVYKFNKDDWNRKINTIKKILLKNIFYPKKKTFKGLLRYKVLYNLNRISSPQWLQARVLTPSEISLSFKHYFALKKISEQKVPSLVVEDDVVSTGNTLGLIQNAFKLCLDGFDYVDLGGIYNFPYLKNDIKLSSNSKFISLGIPRTNTTAAYMIAPKTAKILLKNILPLTFPIDWQYQYIFIKNNLKVAWAKPPAFINGSMDGNFKSSIMKK